jgi:hypothetical protein
MPRPKSPAKEKNVSVLPNMHFAMLVSAMILTIVFGIGYVFAPAGKEELFLFITSTAVGSIFGKLSNGFGRSFTPLPATIPATRDDTLPDAQE